MATLPQDSTYEKDYRFFAGDFFILCTVWCVKKKLIVWLSPLTRTLSIYYVLPMMGQVFDRAKIQAAGGEEAFKGLTGDGLNQVLTVAAQTSFRYVAVLPAILLVVFGAIWIYDKSKGGYKPVKLGATAVGGEPRWIEVVLWWIS